MPRYPLSATQRSAKTLEKRAEEFDMLAWSKNIAGAIHDDAAVFALIAHELRPIVRRMRQETNWQQEDPYLKRPLSLEHLLAAAEKRVERLRALVVAELLK